MRLLQLSISAPATVSIHPTDQDLWVGKNGAAAAIAGGGASIARAICLASMIRWAASSFIERRQSVRVGTYPNCSMANCCTWGRWSPSWISSCVKSWSWSWPWAGRATCMGWPQRTPPLPAPPHDVAIAAKWLPPHPKLLPAEIATEQ